MFSNTIQEQYKAIDIHKQSYTHIHNNTNNTIFTSKQTIETTKIEEEAIIDIVFCLSGQIFNCVNERIIVCVETVGGTTTRRGT